MCMRNISLHHNAWLLKVFVNFQRFIFHVVSPWIDHLMQNSILYCTVLSYCTVLGGGMATMNSGHHGMKRIFRKISYCFVFLSRINVSIHCFLLHPVWYVQYILFRIEWVLIFTLQCLLKNYRIIECVCPDKPWSEPHWHPSFFVLEEMV